MVRKAIAAVIVSVSLITSSTAAVGSTPLSARAAAPNSWLTLSMLTPSGAASLGSTAVAAAQPATVTCPDGTVVANGAPCPGPVVYTRPGFPPIPVIAVWLATLAVAIYVVSKSRSHATTPNSPA